MKTSERIIASATTLLDEGGIVAVTLRAVGQASGLSHNAPYKHFENRDSLLGAIAIQEFQKLAAALTGLGRDRLQPLTKMKRALQVLVVYGRDYPNRYQLLFSRPEAAAQEEEVQQAAMAAFSAFGLLVTECQRAGVLPGGAPALAGLMYASVHGLIDLQAGGRVRTEKGPIDASEGVGLLLKLFSTG